MRSTAHDLRQRGLVHAGAARARGRSTVSSTLIGPERTVRRNIVCRVQFGNGAAPPEILRASPQD
jgi:hypothetical protein